jgi:hypothetical protein
MLPAGLTDRQSANIPDRPYSKVISKEKKEK